MKVLITLGPTQEPIDKVRFISNASSGKMGKALADEALKRKFSVTLVAGPVNLELPEKAKNFKVKTAQEMIKKTLTELENNYDIFISTAAIADYSPEKISKDKLSSGKKELIITLKPVPKLTSLARKKFPELFIVGFKAEYNLSENELVKKALEKLLDDNLEMVIANDLKNNYFGSDENEVYILKKGSVDHLDKNSKEKIAQEIWNHALKEIKR